jgi:hypothetical protein
MNKVINCVAKAAAIAVVSMASLAVNAGTPINVDVNIGVPGAYPPPQPVYVTPPPIYVQQRPVYLEQRPPYVVHDDWYWECNKHNKCKNKRKKDKHHGNKHEHEHEHDD